MVKRLKYFTLVIATFLLVCSCNSRHNTKYTIGISQNRNDEWHNVVNNEMQTQAEFSNEITLDIKFTNHNTSEQIEQIEKFIDKKVDLLIIYPNDKDSLNDVIAKAHKKDIPVILINTHTSNNDYTAYIGIDKFSLGVELGKYGATLLHSAGNVVIMTGPAKLQMTTEWTEGFTSETSKHPGINIIAQAEGRFSETVAYEQMCNIIDTCNCNIDLVFVQNSMMSKGIAKAFDEHPSVHRPFILGIGANALEGAELIENGIIDAAMLYPTEGFKIITLAYNILTDRPFDRENKIKTTIIDRNNIDLTKLQYSQISERAEKLEHLSLLLKTRRAQAITQWILIGLLTIISILFILLTCKYHKLSSRGKRINISLNEKNEKIESQLSTLQKQQEQMVNLSKQLEDATQAKLMFFTDITHEFKTPLTLILGPVEEILNSGRLNNEDFDTMKMVYRNGNKLMNLLNQILEFRTYENGQMEIQPEMGVFNQFLAEINSMFKPYLNNKGINFEYKTDGYDYTMAFDRDKMDKIYFNLLSNALKYVNSNGIIRVNLTQIQDNIGKTAQLSVFNSGSYIPEDKLKDVFKRFYHIDNEHENSGIGLALTKSLVEAHNGTISVESIADEGTTFTISIPIEKITEVQDTKNIVEHSFVDKQIRLSKDFNDSPDKIDEITNETSPADKKKILIIEDNADMRKYIKLVLNLHYTVIQANNGKDGIKKAIVNVPDLIITDIMMPGMDGFQVCEELKSNVITKKIPIICLTACATDEEKIRSYNSGADAYLTKPFNANVLRIRIKKLIEKSDEIASSNETELFLGDNTKTLGDKQRAFMSKIKDYVEAHIQDNISIEELSKELGVSKSSFYRQLKEITDYNPVDIISLIKLKAGIRLMLVNHQSITEAAYATGFSSSSYFAKIFYKFYKETPSEYMKRYTKTEG